MNFFKTLDAFGERVALRSEETGPVTYREMLERADDVGSRLDRRSLVFILGENTVESVSAYVGVMRSGSVAVLLDKGIKDAFLTSLIEAFRPRYLHLNKATFEILRALVPALQSGTEVYARDTALLIRLNVDDSYEMHPDLALLLTTSGSTGTQKFVRQSYKNIRANTESIATYLGITGDDRAITTLPMSYTYGLSIIQSHLFSGASIVLTDASVMERRFWDLCSSYEVTTMGGVPYTYEILKRIGFERMDLPHIRYITQAGGKLSKEMSEFFAKSCEEKHIQFIVMYGQTEATARMSYLPSADAVRKAGSIGIPIPGGSMHLVDESGDRIDTAYTPGELLYTGDNVTLGYALSYADLSKADENNGVLHTGDVAQRDDDGYYYIVGRLNRYIKVLGKRINLDEIETWLRKNGYDGACTGTDDDLRVYITSASAEKTVADLLRETFGLRAPFVNIRYIETIPRNASNKILYTSLP